jgi:hypothetical protein
MKHRLFSILREDLRRLQARDIHEILLQQEAMLSLTIRWQ